MKPPKNTLILLGLIISFMSLTGFSGKRKPHLIVGLWQITEHNSIPLNNSKAFIEQLYFGSDELSSSFSFNTKKGKSIDKQLRLAYQTYDDIEEFNMPVLYFISTCDKNFKLAFTIEKLSTDSLTLKWIKDVSSKDIILNRETITFERIAGPPENMPHTEDAIQLEIKVGEE